MAAHVPLSALVLGLFALSSAGHAQPGGPSFAPAPGFPGGGPFPGGPPRGTRTVYAVQNGNAAALAEVLGNHFRGDAVVSVLPGAGQSLLVTASPAVTEEITKLLAKLDRPAKSVEVEVILAELTPGRRGDDKAAEAALAAADVLATLDALQKDGRVGAVQRIKFTTVDGQPVTVKTGGNKPVVTGRTASPAGAVQLSVQYHAVGTTVKATARVGADDAVTVDLTVEDSRVRPPEAREEPKPARGPDPAAPAAKPADPVVEPKSDRGRQPGGGFPGGGRQREAVEEPVGYSTDQDSLTTRVTVAGGRPVLARAVRTDGKAGTTTALVIVTARVVDPGPKSGK